MTYPSDPAQGPLRLAERLIQLLDQGSFSATYKYAVLLALMDLCLERTSATGQPPDTLTTRMLAEKVIQLYWPHCAPFDGDRVLRQSTGGANGQAEILRRIIGFREEASREPGASLSLTRARAQVAPQRWESLVWFVEWKLIEMPLPRLQYIGNHEDRFLYEIGWHLSSRAHGWKVTIAPQEIRLYQRGEVSTFDNRILLKPGVSEQLVQLSGVLRPLIHRQWAMMVAKMNRLEESRLEAFLFGGKRIDLSPVRQNLRDLQNNRCFYCLNKMDARCEVDHFIPWARYADNGIDNLVVTHASCNNHKRDFLAAAEHVERWQERSRQSETQLLSIAAGAAWESNPERVFNTGRALYSRLPEDAKLWRLGDEFVSFERARVLGAFVQPRG